MGWRGGGDRRVPHPLVRAGRFKAQAMTLNVIRSSRLLRHILSSPFGHHPRAAPTAVIHPPNNTVLFKGTLRALSRCFIHVRKIPSRSTVSQIS